MATFYPKSVKFFLNNVSTSRQRFRHRLESPSASAVPNDTLIMSLPSTNVLLDAFAVGADLSSSAAGGTYSRLSRGTESLMQQIQVETNGTMIDPGCRFTNVLADTLNDWMIDESITPLRSIMQNAYTTTPASSNSFHTAQPIIISSFTGFINTAQPRVFPCDLCPLRVHIRLADTKVLVSDAAGTATYTLDNPYVYYETISFEDGGLLEASLREGLLKAPLEVPFDMWTAHSPGPTPADNNTLVNINSESLDLLLGVVMNSNALYAPNTVNTTTLKSQYFNRGWGANVLQSSQFMVQGVPFPAWRPSLAEQFVQTAQNFGKLNDSVGGAASWLMAASNATGSNVLNQYANNGYSHLVRFDYPDADEVKENRLRSGLNTSGTGTAGIEWETIASTSSGNVQKVLFAKQTAVLLIGAGQQVAVRR